MKLITKLLIVISALTALLIPSVALAADNNLFSVCDNPDAANSAFCKSKGTTNNPVIHVIKVATDIVAILTGIAAVILIIISGLTLITSGGNSEAVANARKRIVNVVIGVVIVALAWTIVTFATDKLIK